MSIVSGFCKNLLPAVKPEISQLRYKRRRVNPAPWVPAVYQPVRALLYKEDRRLVEATLPMDPTWNFPQYPPLQPNKYGYMPFHLIPGVDNPPDCRGNKFNSDTSKRIGMIGRKIGMTLQWMTDGTRCLCTMIHFPQNVVLSANDPATWYKHSPTGKYKAFTRFAPHWNQMVGAMDQESVFYSKQYRQIFLRAGVPCKKTMGGFMVSEDAIVKPGTTLDVRHFQVGQYVKVAAKSIDWGFQGVMHRWGMRGQPRRRTTKAHRRVGAIGAKGEAKVWLGRRLPGHMGYEWTHQPGLLVLRINPIEQVMYVRGNVPGDMDEFVLVNDSMGEEKRLKNPPFPTFYPDQIPEEELNQYEELHQIHNCTSRDLFHPKLFQMTQPSIVYTEEDETKSKARDKSRAKTAKVKK